MRVVIASGKGGTGKTTIATSFAAALARAGRQVAFLDCDVEEPNGHLSLRPIIHGREQITVPAPEVAAERCDGCGDCSRACRNAAIITIAGRVLTFPQLCRGCGGCVRACPAGAITETSRSVGEVEWGESGSLAVVQGRLAVGEQTGVPVVRAVLRRAPRGHIAIVDAPPGTGCAPAAALLRADVALLVAEPTAFGLHDLQLAVEMARALAPRIGVIVNRLGMGDARVHEYCVAEGLPILMEVDEDRRIAEGCARGVLAIDVQPDLEKMLRDLWVLVERLPAASAPSHRVAALELAAVDETAAPPAGARGAAAPFVPAPMGTPTEIVVASGKGGTGKTSVTASLATLAGRCVTADCDVDAANLHLIARAEPRRREPFVSGLLAHIDADACTGCGICADLCRFGALSLPADPRDPVQVDPSACDGCGVCADACVTGAVHLEAPVRGEWMLDAGPHGPLVHAQLLPGTENSGKLVHEVRRQAKLAAASNLCDLIITDGPPGIGCPVISSITGATLVLLVTEPTWAALHDLERVAALCRHFQVPAVVCINKADLCPSVADEVAARAAHMHMPVLARIPYDPAVVAAQIAGHSVVEHGGDSPAATAIRALWEKVLAAAHDAASPPTPGQTKETRQNVRRQQEM